MLILITGGSASGKSAYGEKLLAGYGAKKRYYLATMEPWGEEGERRVARHRRQREGKGFRTLEHYHHLEELSLREEDPSDCAVLLECMSNLVANEQFTAGGTDEEILGRIRDGVTHLLRQAGTVLIVTNEVFSDGGVYEEETRRYLRILGQVNRELAAMADVVTEVVYGIPVPVKG